eukprot:6466567-Amphidinium_carterae.1
MGYAGVAKQSHIEAGHTWNEALQLAWRKCHRAARRGIGAESRAARFPTLQLAQLPDTREAYHPEGPIYPRRAVVLMT